MCDCCEKYYYQKEDLPSEICDHIKSYIKYSSEKAVSAACSRIATLRAQ